MKGVFEREFIAQLVIILSISLGGWMLLVYPKVKKFDEMQSVFRTVSNDAASFSEADIEQLAAMLAEGRRRVDAIAARNRLTRNTTVLYSIVSDNAAKQDVTLQSLTPTSSGASRHGEEWRGMRINMVLEGRYDRIAAFIASVQKLPGFLRPVALTLKPVGEAEADLAVADYSCEILQFHIPSDLEGIGAFP